MSSKQIEIVILLEIKKLKDKDSFDSYVKKEGFKIVQNEDFVYTAKSSTQLFATKAYILEVFSKALIKQDFKGEASLIFLLNETPYPTYVFKEETKDFRVLEKN